MTPVADYTKYFVLLTAFWVLSAGGVQAQQALPTPPALGDLDALPELALPAAEMEQPPQPTTDSAPPAQTEGGNQVSEPELVPEDALDSSGAYYLEPEYCHNRAEAYDLWDGYPATPESSGTWLRRGFWYAEADAVVYDRIWNRDDLRIAQEGAVQPQNTRLLFLEGDSVDAAVRLTLGRFLFRDERNRNHSAEFTIYGGGDWEQEGFITSIQPNNVFISFFLSGNNPSLDTANMMQMDYSSRFNSFEANYRLKTRMTRDQMVLKPTGEWVRRASPTWTQEYLAGFRFLDLTERLRIVGRDIATFNNEDGEYFIRTDNNMVGIQFGLGHAYESDRWGVEGIGKIGALVNDAKGRQRFIIQDNEDVSYNERMASEELSFIMEARLTARWHLRPNVSLRASLECLFINNVALAPHQITFRPDAELSSKGDPYYQGVSCGIEGYW